MKHHRGWGFRGALLAAAAGIVVFSPAAVAQPAAGESPGAALRRQLTELAANPTSVSELIETGRAAIAVGDGEAALGFFTRANQLAPRDARVKAGLAAATARTGRPESALLLFSEAIALGAPEREIAAERGLAYDLLGQAARAQQDYHTSLRHREDAEVRRRLALSLAISGQREAALQLVDQQVRQGDRAAGRARIMVLALSGDVRGATAQANATLPAQAAQSLAPFLSRLPSLSPGQMAAAANLGRVPTSGGMRMAAATPAADPAALAFAGGRASPSTSLPGRLPITPVDTLVTRRRPDSTAAAAIAPTGTPVPQRSWNNAAATVRPAPASVPSPSPATALTSAPAAAAVAGAGAILLPHPHEPLQLAALPISATPSLGGPAGQEPVELAGASQAPRVPPAVLAAPASDEPVATVAAASTAPVQATVEPTVAPSAALPAAQTMAAAAPQVADPAALNLAVWTTANPAATPSAPAAPAASSPERTGFADVVAVVSALPTETASAPSAAPSTSRPPATTPARAPAAAAATPRRTAPTIDRAAAARATAAVARSTARTPQQAHPSRVWVQLGVAPTRSAFGFEINRMRRAAPDLLRGKNAHAAPIGSSQRLLVGPFPDEAAARTFVNSLKQKDIDALSWTSPAGTQVDRLPAGR